MGRFRDLGKPSSRSLVFLLLLAATRSILCDALVFENKIFEHVPAVYGAKSGTTIRAPVAVAGYHGSDNCESFCKSSCRNSVLGNVSGAVLVVRRGECTFSTKTILAQREGAVAVIVANNQSGGTLVLMQAASAVHAEHANIMSSFVSMATGNFINQTILQLVKNASNTSAIKFPYIILNTTGQAEAYMATGPLLWNALLFVVQMFVIAWAFISVGVGFRFCHRRILRRQRSKIVENLPRKKYRKGNGDENEERAPSTSGAAAISPSESEPCQQNECAASASFHRASSSSTSSDLEGIELAIMDAPDAETIDTERGDGENAASEQSPVPKRKKTKKKRKKKNDVLNDNCVICIEDFEDGEYYTRLPCGHGFHTGCINPWLIEKSALCPICKQSILPSGDSRAVAQIPTEDLAAPWPFCARFLTRADGWASAFATRWRQYTVLRFILYFVLVGVFLYLFTLLPSPN